MAKRHQQHASDSKLDGDEDEEKTQRLESHTAEEQEPSSTQDRDETHEGQDGDDDENDDSRLSTSSIIELDPKDLLIVKDGTVRVAMSVDRDQQKLDANGEAVKATGTWTKAEHERFLRAMQTYPKGPWKSIAEMVATRTVRQTQTHAQKYREKMARRMRGLRNRNGTLQTPPQAMPDMPALAYPRSTAIATSPFTAALPVQQQHPHPHQHQRQHQHQHLYPSSYQQLRPQSPYQQLQPHAQAQIQSHPQPHTHPHPIAMGYSSAVMASASASASTSALTSQAMMPVVSSSAMSRVTAVPSGTAPASSIHQHEHQYQQHYTSHPSQLHPPRYTSTSTSTSTAVLSDAEFNQLSQSSISSAFLENATYPSSWEAGRSEGKEAVPGFDESMDFLMSMYSADPNQINVLPPPPAQPPRPQLAVPSSDMITPTASAPRVPRTASPSPSRTRKRRESQSESPKKRARTSRESTAQYPSKGASKSDSVS